MHAIRRAQRVFARRGIPTSPSRAEAALVFMMLWAMLDYLLETAALHPSTDALIDQFCDLQNTWELPEAYRLAFWG
jgi:hypothetical protein